MPKLRIEAGKKFCNLLFFDATSLDLNDVEDAIERARTIAFKETGEYSRGGEEDIFEAMAGDPPYITLKKIT